MNKNDFQDLSIAVTVTLVIIAIVILGVIALAFVGEGFVRPNILDMRREGNQRSQQYVQTTRDQLFVLKRKYDDLEADINRLSGDQENTEVVNGMLARQESLLDEMEQESQSIPRVEVPTGVKQLLIDEGRWNDESKL